MFPFIHASFFGERPEPRIDTSSLYRYRLQSRKILSTIKDSLPANLQKVEKASIDEVVGSDA